MPRGSGEPVLALDGARNPTRLRAMRTPVPGHILQCPALALLLAAPIALGACPNFPSEMCGITTAAPEVADATGEATRSDSDDFTGQDASWAPGSSASLTIGLLDMIIVKDQTGTDTEDLIADAAFPICVKLAEQSETSGSALLNGGSFATDAGHTGAVVIVAEEGGFLAGRFEVDLVDGSGANLSFSDGAFKARRR